MDGNGTERMDIGRIHDEVGAWPVRCFDFAMAGDAADRVPVGNGLGKQEVPVVPETEAHLGASAWQCAQEEEQENAAGE